MAGEFTEAQLDAFVESIADAKGARHVQKADEAVTFNSIDDLLKLRAAMQDDVTTAANATKHYRLASTRKGL